MNHASGGKPIPWKRAVCLLMRFYSLSMDQVLNGFTIDQFNVAIYEMHQITKMEHGKDPDEDTPLTGPKGAAVASAIFRKD